MKYLLTVLLTSLFACALEAKPIEFGQDQCHYCKMTIVNRQFAAQCVTRKGKQFHYDAAECLVQELAKNGNESEMSMILVSNYAGGPTLNAGKAGYLISPKIKSPMGAFLSAFANQEEAARACQEQGGKVYTWQALKARLAAESP